MPKFKFNFRAMLAKGAVGLVISALLGYTWKLGKEIDDDIDEYFDKKDDSTETEEDS